MKRRIEAGTGPAPAPARARRAVALTLLPLLAGSLLAAALLESAFGARSTNFEEAALGQEQQSVWAHLDGDPIHCKDLEDGGACIDGFHRRGATAAAVWLGNSQLHAINQYSPGEETAAPQLHRRLQRQGLDLLTFSQPNASLQEHYVLFEYLKSRLPLRLLILPVVFDDLRETGIRAGLAPALRDGTVAAELRATEVGRRILAEEETGVLAGGDLAGLRRTVQEHTEQGLNDWLSQHTTLWSLRAQARGDLLLGLHKLRNSVFGISAQSKRKVIRARYERNMEALRAILADAARDGIAVLVYVVPLRDDLETPYVQAEYESFKDDLRAEVEAGGARFADLEALIPPRFWGSKDATTVGSGQELDFMHFRAAGHALLAEALGGLLEPATPSEPR